MDYSSVPYKIYLEESQMPDSWYNVRADMKKKPAPLLDPATGKPITEEKDRMRIACRRKQATKARAIAVHIR